MYKKARYLNGSYFVKFRGKIFTSEDLDTLFNNIKQEYLRKEGT